MGAHGFWDDQAAATRISTEHARLTRKLDRYERLQGEYEDAAMAFQEGVTLARAQKRSIPELHLYLGESLAHLERYSEAEAEYREEL